MTQIITEATLVAPVFCGSDEEIAGATNSWSSIVNALSYMNSMYIGNQQCQMSPENKKALFASLMAYSQCKMDELNNVTQPPTVTTMMPTVPPVAPEVAVVAPVVAPDSYAESEEAAKEKALAEAKTVAAAKNLQRLRELAGIPHAMNRV
jgi:hypothetical protein